jgi:Bacterial HORMA domain family 1
MNMSTSFALTETTTFTVTHARHMASKVAADLKRLQRFYGEPSDARIANYETELIELLKAGFLAEVTYGYQRNGSWIEPTLRYTSQDLQGMAANDDDPGKVRAGADVSGARFCSFLTYSWSYHIATEGERAVVHRLLPFSRSDSDEPGVTGYFSDERTYSAGGQALNRKSVRSW